MENYTDIQIFKLIIKLELTRNDLKTLVFLKSLNQKTITLSNVEIAKKIGFTPSNFLRILKKLEDQNIIGKRPKKPHGIFIYSISQWKKSDKKKIKTEL